MLNKKYISFRDLNKLAAHATRVAGRSVMAYLQGQNSLSVVAGEFVSRVSKSIAEYSGDEALGKTLESVFWTFGLMTPTGNLFNGLSAGLPATEIVRVLGTNLGRYYGGQITAEALRSTVKKNFPENHEHIMPWVEAALDVGAAALFPIATIEADGSQYSRSYSIQRGLIQDLQTKDGIHIAIDATGASVTLGKAKEIHLDALNDLPPEIQLVDKKLAQVSYQDTAGNKHVVFLLKWGTKISVYSENQNLVKAILKQNGLKQSDEKVGAHRNANQAIQLGTHLRDRGKYHSLREHLGIPDTFKPPIFTEEVTYAKLAELLGDKHKGVSDAQLVAIFDLLSGDGFLSVAEGGRAMASTANLRVNIEKELETLFLQAGLKDLKVIQRDDVLYVYNPKGAKRIWLESKHALPHSIFNGKKTFSNFLRVAHTPVADFQEQQKEAVDLDRKINNVLGRLYGFPESWTKAYSEKYQVITTIITQWKRDYPEQEAKLLALTPELKSTYNEYTDEVQFSHAVDTIEARTQYRQQKLPRENIVRFLRALLTPKATAFACQEKAQKVGDGIPTIGEVWLGRQYSKYSNAIVLSQAQRYICEKTVGETGDPERFHISGAGLRHRTGQKTP